MCQRPTCTIKPTTKTIATQETMSAWFCMTNSWLRIGGFLFELLRPFIATILAQTSACVHWTANAARQIEARKRSRLRRQETEPRRRRRLAVETSRHARAAANVKWRHHVKQYVALASSNLLAPRESYRRRYLLPRKWVIFYAKRRKLRLPVGDEILKLQRETGRFFGGRNAGMGNDDFDLDARLTPSATRDVIWPA